jgi:hypothetical protein
MDEAMDIVLFLMYQEMHIYQYIHYKMILIQDELMVDQLMYNQVVQQLEIENQMNLVVF